MNDDVYRHAHKHNQQPGNEWNDRVRPTAGGSSSGSGGFAPASGGRVTNTGAPDGSGFVVLGLVGLVVVLPAAAMALVATTILKPLGPALGSRFSSHSWSSTLWTTLLGSMWYLGLTLAAVLGLGAYVTYGLSTGPFDSLPVWDQWLASAWWSTLRVIDGIGQIYGAGAGTIRDFQWPAAPAPLWVTATAGAIPHLPGVAAYSFILRRAGYVGGGWRGLALGLGLGVALVLVTVPLAMWLAGLAVGLLE